MGTFNLSGSALLRAAAGQSAPVQLLAGRGAARPAYKEVVLGVLVLGMLPE